jgi:hypothetical protein
MADIASKFTNLPLETLISAPLVAAANSNLMLANATYDFIQNVWFEKNNGTANTRLLEFNVSEDKESGGKQDVKVSAPLAALLQTPNLMINSIDIDFSMEVKDVSTAKNDITAKADLALTAKGVWWSAKLTGSLSSNSSNSRSTDHSAKYDISLRAEQARPTEGMERLSQLFASAISREALPAKAETTPGKNDGASGNDENGSKAK